MDSSNPIFTKINNPHVLRKIVIESAIDSALLIKDYNKLLERRKRIEVLKSRFLMLFEDIEKQIEILSNTIPHIKIHKPKTAKAATKIESPKLEREELDYIDDYHSDLESELQDIERKLKNLSF